MTRRKPPAIDPDDYGFELVGDEFNVQPQELVCLIGLDSLARDLYFMCLRPFADPKTGEVHFASYYRFIHRLTPSSSARGGPRRPGPTRQQVFDALTRLAQAGVINVRRTDAKRDRVLKIEVVRRFGVVSSDSVGRKVRQKAGSSQSRAIARLKAELHTG